MIRDEEFKRLTKYAEGMGLKVKIQTKGRASSAAEWTLDGTEITVYRTDKSISKIDMVLSMIHEIGHHLWFIHQKERLPDLKFDQAIEIENLVQDRVRKVPAPKKLRKKILSVEIAGTRYWEVIYKETNCKFPIWLLHEAMEFDIWQYEHYYKYGKFPNRLLRREKSKELRLKHRPKV